MKRWIQLLAAAGLTASMAGADTLSFIGGGGNTLDSSTNSLALTVNTANDTVINSVENVNLINNITIAGANSVNDDFLLTFNAGFGFDPSGPTWDTTDHPSGDGFNNLRIVSGGGIGPDGGNPDFYNGEILWFEVSGLDAGNSLQFNGFTMQDDGGAESDFLSYYTTGANPSGATAVTDGGVVVFGSALTLNNGDRFGIAYTHPSQLTANRSRLQTLDIEVIPEPATLGLITAFGGGLLLIRRRFMM